MLPDEIKKDVIRSRSRSPEVKKWSNLSLAENLGLRKLEIIPDSTI